MAWSKTKTAGAVTAGILLAAGITIAVFLSKRPAANENDPVAYAVLHRSLLQKLFRQEVNEHELRRQLLGTWEMAAVRSRRGTNYFFLPTNNNHLKIFTQTTWSIVGYDDDSNMVYSAGGPYQLRGNTYTETIESATGFMTNFIGAHPRFKIILKGDKYYQLGQGNNIHEIWQRMPH